MKFTSDIDIDFADRMQLLEHVQVTQAARVQQDKLIKHNTGVHPQIIPYDPVNQIASIDYEQAEQRGYIKLDLLNVWLYKHVKNEQHLYELMVEPEWARLQDPDFFSRLIHIGRHYNTMLAMPEPIDSIPRMAMFLAVIRPGKKHLIGKTWTEVSKTIWDRDVSGYTFRKSHAIAYAHLVVVHINLLVSDPTSFVSPELYSDV